MEAHHRRLLKNHSALLRRLRQPIHLTGIDGEGLFDQGVLSGSRRLHPPGDMQPIGKGYVHDIHFIGGEHPFIAAESKGNPLRPGIGTSFLFTAAGHRRDPGPLRHGHRLHDAIIDASGAEQAPSQRRSSGRH